MTDTLGTEDAPEHPDGLRVEETDEAVLPVESIRDASDPRISTGRFTRPGITWFVNTLFTEAISGSLQDNTQLEIALRKYDELAHDVLKRSTLLQGLDLNSVADVQEALRRIGDNHYAPELWALRVRLAVSEAQQGLDEGDARRAAWAALWVAAAWPMIVFLQQLEPLVWQGYQAYGPGVLEKVLEVWEANQANSDEEFWQKFFSQYPLYFLADPCFSGGCGRG
jgi:hypothetical protein